MSNPFNNPEAARVMVAKMIKEGHENLIYQEKIQELAAKELKIRYDAFVKVGFTPEQAMQLLLR